MESYSRSHKSSGQKSASRTRSGLTLGMSKLASTKLFCMVKARFPCMMEIIEGLDVTLDDLAGLHRWIVMDG